MQDLLDKDNISIVFQGPVGHRGGDLENNIRKTRQVFPKAEFILSTWQDSDELVFNQFDKVILNRDPGPIYSEPVAGYPNNILRQVVSTAKGLNMASNKYAIKIRTDFSIENDGFIEQWLNYVPAKPETVLFKKPVAILSLGCSDPVRRSLLFHPSDYFYFGLREDLLLYWNVENQVKDNKNLALSINEKILHPLYGMSFGRLAIEQELFCLFLMNKYEKNISFRYRDQFGKELLKLSEDLLLNNFVLLDVFDSGIVAPKRIQKISKLKHHYEQNSVTAVLNGNRAVLRSRYVGALITRYKYLPRQVLLTIYSLVAYFVLIVCRKK